MQAYLTLGSAKHLRAASNAFEMLKAQSFATGGWGPDEQLRAPGSGEVAVSLTNTHNSFETPCGSYAHFKLTRYLLRVTQDSRYGDSMERVMYNTVLGAKPLLADGSTFYYSDYNFHAHKVFTKPRWPCCSGTLPQVAADYRIKAYFSDSEGLYVNLYVPSTVRWSHEGAQMSLIQKSEYPFDGAVKFELASSKAADFAIHLRIPEWAVGATISINDKTMSPSFAVGQFATLRRTWKKGGYRVAIVSYFTIGAGMAVLQVAINPLLRVAGGEEHYAFNSTLAQLIFGSASFISPRIYSYLVLHLKDSSRDEDFFLRILRKLTPPALPWASIYWIFTACALAMVLMLLFFEVPQGTTHRGGTRGFVRHVPQVGEAAGGVAVLRGPCLPMWVVNRERLIGSRAFWDSITVSILTLRGRRQFRGFGACSRLAAWWVCYC